MSLYGLLFKTQKWLIVVFFYYKKTTLTYPLELFKKELS